MSDIIVKDGTLEYLQADNLAVPHCFTTRLGGVSTGIFDSLNLSFSRGDDPACVLENYRRIGIYKVYGKQTSLFCHRKVDDK